MNGLIWYILFIGSGSFYPSWLFWDISTLHPVSTVHFFFYRWVVSSRRCGCTAVRLPMYQPRNIWVVSSLGLLQTKLLWTSLCVDKYFHPIGKVLRSGTAGSCGKWMFTFLKHCQTVFQGGCTTFRSNQQLSSSSSTSSSTLGMASLFNFLWFWFAFS